MGSGILFRFKVYVTSAETITIKNDKKVMALKKLSKQTSFVY